LSVQFNASVDIQGVDTGASQPPVRRIKERPFASRQQQVVIGDTKRPNWTLEITFSRIFPLKMKMEERGKVEKKINSIRIKGKTGLTIDPTDNANNNNNNKKVPRVKTERKSGLVI